MTLADALTPPKKSARRDAEAVPTITGQVMPIRLLPDPLSEDRITIGVAFIDAAGITHCQLADDYTRLRCLYGDAVDVGSFEFLRDVLVADLGGTSWAPRDPPSDNVEYGKPFPAAGLSVSEILQRSFSAIVPFATPKPAGTGRSSPILTDSLRLRVVAELSQRMGAQAGKWLQTAGIQLPSSFGRGRVIHFPLQNRASGAAADVVSAWSGTKHTIISNVQRSVTNMLAIRYAEVAEKQRRPLGLFVLRPGSDDGFSSRQLNLIYETVDDLVSLARGADVTVDVAANIPKLVDQLVNWQQKAA